MGKLRAAIAALALVFAPAVAHAGELDGVWTGSYVCAQGETALTLTVRDAEGAEDEILAQFDFSALPSNPDVPSGSFAMRGVYRATSANVSLLAAAWRSRPDGYEMVDLYGALAHELNADVISGEVRFPQAPELCTTFRVERRRAPLTS